MTCMFDGYYSLKSINLSTFDTSDVMYLNSLFYNCKQLTTVTGLSHVTVIGGSAFYRCYALTHIDNIDKIVTINNSEAFRECTSLTRLDTDNLTSIGNTTFYGCTALTYVNTSNVTHIGESAFQITTSLKSLDLSNVRTMGTSVFYRAGIKNIDLPNLTTSISNLGQMIRESQVETVTFNEDSDMYQAGFNMPSSFADSCSTIRSINIAHGVREINNWAFGNCPSLEDLGGIPKPTKFNGDCNFYNTKISAIDLEHITNIPNSCFRYCRKLTSIGNCDNVEYIRAHSFRDIGTSGEPGLGEISFPNCVLVEQEVFEDSYGITKINFGNVVELKSWAFAKCRDLQYITGLDNVTIVRDACFYNASSLKEISLPNLEEFADGGSHFAYCTSLTSVNLPKLKKFKGNQTFKSCRIDGLLNLPVLTDPYGQETFSGAKIKKIYIPSCTKLYQYQFEGNDLLEEIDLTSCETFTGRNIFYSCSALKNIELPSLIGDIPYFTFRYCSSLETITFGNNPIRLTQECMRDNEKLKTINLDHATYIGDYALLNSSKLESFGAFSNELTYIGREAFENCSKLAGNITIPASVTTIGYRAFYNCGSITSITMEATTPPTMNNESFNGALTYPIYVPAGSVDAYKNATNWRNIASRIFAAP